MKNLNISPNIIRTHIKINPANLRYCPDIKQKFLITENKFALTNSKGEELSTIFYLRTNNCVSILDMSSANKNCGYGSKLINKFTEYFKESKIFLSACWERIISSMPPHKFYMQNGFKPVNQKAADKLNEWIAKGANTKDFPMEYELCEMVKLPKP